MDVRISFNVGIVAAVVAAELVSLVWYQNSLPWGGYGDRFLLAAIISDVALAFVLQWIVHQYYSVNNLEAMAFLSLFISLVYFLLEAPHVVHNHRSLANLTWHALHKFVVVFVMLFALKNAEKYIKV